MPKLPIIFIHVPKTAGTSFRSGAEQYFGPEKICKNYGPESEETSEAVREWILQKDDPWYFKKAFTDAGYCLFSGHVHAQRYAQLFGMENMVTFLRDPLQRIVSEYKHFSQHLNYQQSFEIFYRTDRFINKQLRIFQRVPWPALGFIGITERYDLSLRFINRKFEIAIPSLEINVDESKVTPHHQLSLEQEQELRTLNAKEIVFYNQALRQLRWRKKMSKSGQVFVRGMIDGMIRGRLMGWAVYEEGDEPVMLKIAINGNLVGRIAASENRPNLRALGLRRDAFVGFSLRIPTLTTGDEISVTVAETGQPLANSPWQTT